MHVRLRCGEFSGGEDQPLARETERALFLLWMEDLADRVTVGFTLARDARLKDLWALARRLGVRHLDAVRVSAGADACFHADLLAVVQDIGRDLEARAVPVDFRPVTRIVRRLLRSGSQHPLHQIDSCHFFSDTVLDLQPRIDFEEVELARCPVIDELDRARRAIADCTPKANRGIEHGRTGRVIHAGRWRFLHHLLIATLQ